MAEKLQSLLVLVYDPALWTLAAIHAAVGIIGLVFPQALRRVFNLLVHKGPVRMFGLLLMLFGTLMSLRSEVLAFALLVKIMGILSFVGGGIALLIPMAFIVPASWSVQRKNRWMRVFAIVVLGLAVLLYLATRPAPIPIVEEAIQVAK